MHRVICAILLFLTPVFAHAVPFGGIEFPDGAVSFADAVVSYEPNFAGGPVPSAAHSGTFNLLGIPDAPSPFGECLNPDPNLCTVLSLGNGGRVVVQFTDNFLTRDGTPADDLHIFEAGPAVERTFIEVSEDGIAWIPVGDVSGATAGVDLDAFPGAIALGDQFFFVRLTDEFNPGAVPALAMGADIDAVGAICCVPPVGPATAVPIPWYAMALLSLMLLGLGSRSFRAHS